MNVQQGVKKAVFGTNFGLKRHCAAQKFSCQFGQSSEFWPVSEIMFYCYSTYSKRCVGPTHQLVTATVNDSYPHNAEVLFETSIFQLEFERKNF